MGVHCIIALYLTVILFASVIIPYCIVSIDRLLNLPC